MAYRNRKYLPSLTVVLLMAVLSASAQQTLPPPTAPVAAPQHDTSNIPRPELGPYDTIMVPAQDINGELLAASTQAITWVTARMTPASRTKCEEWTRMRDAVYVTYPYARRAGLNINEMNAKLALLDKPADRK